MLTKIISNNNTRVDFSLFRHARDVSPEHMHIDIFVVNQDYLFITLYRRVT